MSPPPSLDTPIEAKLALAYGVFRRKNCPNHRHLSDMANKRPDRDPAFRNSSTNAGTGLRYCAGFAGSAAGGVAGSVAGGVAGAVAGGVVSVVAGADVPSVLLSLQAAIPSSAVPATARTSFLISLLLEWIARRQCRLSRPVAVTIALRRAELRHIDYLNLTICVCSIFCCRIRRLATLRAAWPYWPENSFEIPQAEPRMVISRTGAQHSGT
jgi:hypothetical protein